jgi:hypothetical protein
MFSVEIILPSGKKKRIKELKNREYLNIIKYCENRDYKGLSIYFDDLYIDDDLDIFDRFYLLIYARMLFVNENLTFTTREQRDVDVSLANILEKLEQNYKDLESRITHKNIIVDLGLPNCTYFDTIDSIFMNIIKVIHINGKTLDFTSLTESEKQTVLSTLPSTIFPELKKYLDSVSSNIFDVVLLEGNESFGISEIKLNIIGNGVMRFLLNIYNNDLSSYYELMYAFYQHITKGSDVFFDITPVESKILLNIHNKTIKKENEELQKQNRE